MKSENEIQRIEWIRQQLQKLPAGSRLLDAGAGEQAYRPYCTHLKYVSQDFAQYDPKAMNRGLQMEKWDYGTLDIVSDITSIPEPDKSFDAILCSEVFEHIPDPQAAMKEFSRLLRPQGKLILTAPFCSMTHFAPYHFSTGFNRYFYEHHLPLLGFTIDSIDYNGNYFDYLGQELKRADHVAIEYASDKPSWMEYQALKIVRRMMKRFSTTGKSSTELLSMGLHVAATRQ
ncbi:MAG TPA: class I SAM-dependent methyltransferase [Bacteroidia bacterium]|nr:class I SAM-dependent methyltransferase [Bacteroidia bacterium]